MKIAPSLLAANTSDMKTAIDYCVSAGADIIHWDVMDGHFVPNLTFGLPVIRDSRSCSTLPFEVHLMVTNPGVYVMELAQAGAQMVSFHIEADVHSHRLLSQIRHLGMKAGLALNPQTSHTQIEYLLDSLDYIIVMAVNPGFAGQKFITGSLAKISALKAMRESFGYQFEIMVDGGVNADNAKILAHAGTDIVVAGKAFFSANNKSDFVSLIHSANNLKSV
jgi:ribulose-phosphate 3-epimerase